MTSVKKILEELDNEITKITNQGEILHIVNAGRMNHGKSSLFNSLLGKDEFEVADVRMTKECTARKYRSSVFLVDTPGLDANNVDDIKAYEAYKKANCIVFVHTPKVGELHKNEIISINKIAELFPNKEYFWKHFCVVFTFNDEINGKSLDSIEKKIVEDIEKQCGGKDYPIFRVSNSRYLKGIKQGKETLVKNSGIPELKGFLDKQVEMWLDDAKTLKVEKIRTLLKGALRLLKDMEEKSKDEVNSKAQQLNKKKMRLENMVNNFVENMQFFNQDLVLEENYINQFNSEINRLEQVHANSYYSHY